MKRAFVAAAALLSSTIMSTSAFAITDGTAIIDDPSPAGITDAAAQGVCTQKAADHVGGNTWTGTLDPSTIEGTITSGPTADGNRVIDESSVEPGDGAVQIAETVQVATDPFRIGGSVNMFGMAHVVAAHWDFSQYDFTQAFTWQSTYTFTCNMAELIPVGVHTWLGNPDTQAQENCEGDKNPHESDDRGAMCPWTQTGTAPEERADEYGSIGPVNEGGTLNGHESHGASIPVDPNAVDVADVQVVVCISPGKKGGTWTNKNGYTGDKCTTSWYNGGGMVQPPPYDNLNTGSNNVVTIPAS